MPAHAGIPCFEMRLTIDARGTGSYTFGDDDGSETRDTGASISSDVIDADAEAPR
jgi:hypothetical protein